MDLQSPNHILASNTKKAHLIIIVIVNYTIRPIYRCFGSVHWAAGRTSGL